ncbi:MAG TPA: cytochrome b/b6 domain-containing protein [Terriglobales bacterium]|nr:cytochrome b/b6 domain-containing protein [Terriglobales bacterium]
MWLRPIVVLCLLLGTGAPLSLGAPLQNSDCLACHSDQSLTATINGKTVSLFVGEPAFQKSAHGVLGCTDCHSDVKSIPHNPGLAMPKCGSCHADEQAAYAQSVHGKAAARGNRLAAGCVNCHGDAHAILPATDPASKIFHSNIPITCGRCHEQSFVMSASGLSTQVFFSYEQSVHGRAVSAGSQKAAVCTDCHGSHDILMAGDPKSSIFKFNVPATCGKCHAQQSEQYVQSVHGQAIARGNWLAPVCTDCHGIHTIQAPGNPSSSVSAQALAQITCSRCHQDVRLTREFGVPGGRVASYRESYHGLASRLGSTVVANCASCHGSHLILASTDPRSTINKANLATTCGQCHPGATEKFTRFPIHAGSSPSAGLGAVVVVWIKHFYIFVIFFLVGSMLSHNAVIWRSKALARRKLEAATIVRMTLNQRVQHWILFICFTVLVLSGFALIAPFSSVADWMGITENFRRIAHRIAGVTLIGVAAYHVVYGLATREGRKMLVELWPEKKDLRDLGMTLRYHLGLTREKPRFGRFNYGEKFEYWALAWGTVIMACTGLMAWFQVIVTKWLAGWWIDVALTIHLYEAILATLAILIWHFYQVIFDPDVFPMNWSWWDGRMSIEEYQDEHALDAQTVARVLRMEEAGVGKAAEVNAQPDEEESVEKKLKDDAPEENEQDEDSSGKADS